jgi:O-antigen/teichoic acid export membrane protein
LNLKKVRNIISALLKDPVRTIQLVSLVRQAAPFLAAFLLARSTLSLEAIGQIEWLFFIGYSLSFFWLTGYAQSLLADFGNPESRNSERFASLIKGVIVLSLFAALLALTFGYWDNTIPFRWYALFGMWMLLSLPTGLLPYILYLDKNIKQLHLYNLLYFVGYGVVFLVFGLLIPSVEHLFVSLAGFGLLLFVYMLFHLSKKFPLKDFFRTGLNFPTRALSLSLIALLGGLSLVFDGYLVRWFFQDEAVFAIYRYGARELPLSLTLTAALSNAFIPLIAISGLTIMDQFRKRIQNLMHIIFPITILLMLISEPVFKMVYGMRFMESVFLFDLMLFLVVIRFVFPQTVLIAEKKERFLTLVAVLELFINISASLILMKFLGLPGIVLGTLIAYTFEKISLIIYVKRCCGYSLEKYLPRFPFLIYSISLLSLFILKHLTDLA